MLRVVINHSNKLPPPKLMDEDIDPTVGIFTAATPVQKPVAATETSLDHLVILHLIIVIYHTYHSLRIHLGLGY